MIGSSVFAKLSSLDLDLTSADGTQRIYPNYVRMDAKLYPQLVYDCENYQPDVAMDGPAGTATVDVKVLSVGQTYDDADSLARSVSTALDATFGTWGATVVQGCFLDEVSEDHFVDTDLETILYYTKEMVFKLTINI